MELTSPIFFLSLAALFLVHWLVPSRLRSAWLLFGSYALYSLWDARYVVVLLGSTIFDYVLGLALEGTDNRVRRKTLLALSLSANLGILIYFKYVAFFINLAQSGTQWETFIPLGVSFYTFHSISYILDIYWKKIPACRSFADYALYVSFFPKLISGPIERAESFLGQLRANRVFTAEDFFQGIRILIYGLFLKLCIGDRLAFVIGPAFDHTDNASSLDLWIGFYGYSIQIYADFFGYTLIATGAARLFGIRLSTNFLHPYFAASPQEFWRRWHITLSSWFRDYVFIPLGGSKKRLYFNLMLTMALAGLWHGASAKFVFWGIYHGLLVCLQRLIFGEQKAVSGWKRLLGIPVTFHLVCIGWIFFRAKDFSSAAHFFGRLVGAAPVGFTDPVLVWLGILFGAWTLAIFLCWLAELFSIGGNNERIYWGTPLRGAALGTVLFLVVLLGVTNAEPFVYFYF